MADRGVSARLLERVRSAPVEDLVGEVGDRRERRRAPAQDPVVDLEPAADRRGSAGPPLTSTTVYRASGSPTGTTWPTARPAGRMPRSSRQVSQKWATTTWLAAPAPVRSIVTGPSRRTQPPRTDAAEIERQAVEHLPPRRQPPQGRPVQSPGRGRPPRRRWRSANGRWRSAWRAGSMASSATRDAAFGASPY